MATPNTLRQALKKYLAGSRNTLLLSGTGGALNAVVISPTLVQDYASVTFQTSGTWVGTLQPQVSLDGTNWVNLQTQSAANVNTSPQNFTGNGMYRNDLGAVWLQVVMSAYTSGTATLKAFLSQQSISSQMRLIFPPS